MSITQLVSRVVASVREADAKSRLPEYARGTGVYSSMTVWHYVSENSKGNQCPYCMENNGKDILGSAIRLRFPDHIVVAPDLIYVNLHMTLWGQNTCKCYLYREVGQQIANPETLYGENPL